ncbi:MAG: hypothetical protein JW712_07245 [Dehalococcoidales bacterium]|nr:hypothetical protein [Dehalococcoidales bacterium]
MPAKSRRKRGKNLPPSKRIKAGTVSSPANIAETTDETAEPAAPVRKPVPARRIARAPEIIDPVVSYAHVKPELRMIGILAAAMLVILIILGVTL